jgi:hypothetical protein
MEMGYVLGLATIEAGCASVSPDGTTDAGT